MQVFRRLPLVLVFSLAVAAAIHGPIAQFSDYHRFADTRAMMGVPNAADVLSNAAFAIVAVFGWRALGRSARPARGFFGYAVFVAALFLTAIGSAYYHWAPDDARLTWDRLPIALACAGLLLAVRDETHAKGNGWPFALLTLAGAGASVAWWRSTGDLRPYLFVQCLPLVLIPLWQAIYAAPRADRRAFGWAIALYIAAKLAELGDRQIFDLFGVVSGHTLKHLLAAAGATVILYRFAGRAGKRLPDAGFLRHTH